LQKVGGGKQASSAAQRLKGFVRGGLGGAASAGFGAGSGGAAADSDPALKTVSGVSEIDAGDRLQKVGGGKQASSAAQRLKGFARGGLGGAASGGFGAGAGDAAADCDPALRAVGGVSKIDQGDSLRKVGGGGKALSAAERLKRLSKRDL
ncbi:hypothetical protein ACFL59_12240, partial [Planctomycetota bacterium]